MQATHVFSCSPAKVFGRISVWPRAGAAPGVHVAKGWRAHCGPVGAASGDFSSLTVVFLNTRGRKNSCGESRGGCFQHSCPSFEGGHREEDTWVALSPTQAQQREDVAPLPLQLYLDPSETVVVLPGAVSSLGLDPVCCSVFLRNRPSFCFSHFPAASLLPPSSSPATGAASTSRTLISVVRNRFCTYNGHVEGWCVGGGKQQRGGVQWECTGVKG